MKTIKLHDQGEEVLYLQELLNEKGFTIVPNGVFDDNTSQTVIAYQKQHQLVADPSASWGMFQIMGFNYALCGEKSVTTFVEEMSKSELNQLLLSARFIKVGGMLPALQNKYDEKLAQAYSKF